MRVYALKGQLFVAALKIFTKEKEYIFSVT